MLSVEPRRLPAPASLACCRQKSSPLGIQEARFQLPGEGFRLFDILRVRLALVHPPEELQKAVVVETSAIIFADNLETFRPKHLPELRMRVVDLVVETPLVEKMKAFLPAISGKLSMNSKMEAWCI